MHIHPLAKWRFGRGGHAAVPRRRAVWASLMSIAVLGGGLALAPLSASAAASFSLSSSATTTANTITFSVTINNSGDVNLTNATPVWSLGDCSANAGGSASISAGTSTTFSCTYTVPQATIDAGNSVSITAEVQPKYRSGTPPTTTTMTKQTSTATATITRAPGLSVAVTSDVSTVQSAGDPVAFTVAATNSGNVTLTNVRTDNDAKCSLSPASVASLAPGASTNFTCTYSASASDISAGSFTRSFTARGSGPSGTSNPTATGTSSAVTVVAPAAAAGFSLSSSSTTSGNTITYSVTVTNTGNVALSNAAPVWALSGCSANAGGSANVAVGSSETFSCTYTVPQATIDAGNSVSNTAEVTPTYRSGTPPTTTTMTKQSTTPSATITRAPGLSVAVTSDVSTVSEEGDEVVFTVAATNSGNVTLTSVRTDNDAKCSLSPASVASLAPGASTNFTCTYSASASDISAGSFTRSFGVRGSGPSGTSNPTATGSSNAITVGTPAAAPAFSLSSSTTTSGNTITFSVTVTNTGNVTLSNAAPVWALGDCSANPGGSTSVSVGSSETFSCSYTVTQVTVDAGNSVSFTAEVTPTYRSGRPLVTRTMTKQTITPSATITRAPGVSVAATSDVSTVRDEGDPVVFTVTITNSGNVTLTNVRPDNDPKCSLSPASVASLAPGASTNFTCTYSSTASDISAGSFTRSFGARGNGPSGTSNPTASGSSNAIAGVAPDVMAMAGTLGNGTVDVDYSANVSVRGGTGPYLNWAISGLSGLTITVDPSDSSKAVISGKPEQSGDSQTVTVTVHDSKGRTLTKDYTVNIASGTATAANVSSESWTAWKTAGKYETSCPVSLSGKPYGWHFVLKRNTTSFESLTANFAGGAVVTVPSDGEFLTAGGSNSLSPTYKHAYLFTATPATLTSASAVVDGPVTEFLLSHVCGGVVVPPPDPSLSVTKTASPTVVTSVGQSVTFTVQVENTGDVDLTNVTPDDTLTTAANVPGSPSLGQCPNLQKTAGDSTNVGVLDTDETWTYTCTYVASAGDFDAEEIVNYVEVTAEYDGTEYSDDDDATVVAALSATGEPGLRVVKSADKSTVSEVGEVVRYTVVAVNTGDVDLMNLQMSDSLAPACSLSPIGPADLPVGESKTYTCDLVVTQANLDAGSITNVATGTAKDPDDNPLQDSDDAVVTVERAAEIDVQKTASPTVVTAAGDTVVFTVVATNTGTVTLENLTMDDSLGEACVLAATPQSTPSLVAPGARVTYTCSYTVTAADMAAGGVTNVATGTATDPDGKSVSDSDDVNVVAELAALKVKKSADPTVVAEAGETVTFTVTVTNTGNVTLSKLVMSDSLGKDCVLKSKAGNSSRLAVDADIVFTCKYEVTEADIENGGITNTATANAEGPSGQEVSDEDTVDVDVAPPVDVQIIIQNRNVDPNTGVAIWDVTIQNNSNLPTAGPVGVALVPPAGSTVQQDMCDGDQPWKDGAAGQRVWTCSSSSGGISGSRPRGLAAKEAVGFVVITQGGDLTNLVMGGSITVSGDTVEGNNNASDAVSVPAVAPVLPETGWDPQTGLAIAALLLMVGVALQTQSRRRRQS